LAFLLEHGANKDSRDTHGQTPLHKAAHNGMIECARILLRWGADAAAQTNAGGTALEFAKQQGHSALAAELQQHLSGQRTQWLADEWSPVRTAWMICAVISSLAFLLYLQRNTRMRDSFELKVGSPSVKNRVNQPGNWYAMISYTQRSETAKLLAVEIYNSLREQGQEVWLDVKMDRLNEAAMQEAAENSGCIIAVITGEEHGDVSSAYFRREYCISELRWARQAGVPIQPVVAAKDKTRIGEFLSQAPSDLQDLGSVDFIHLDGSRPRYWKAGIEEVMRNIRDIGEQQPHPGRRSARAAAARTRRARTPSTSPSRRTRSGPLH
jgi:hypothetical protein